MSPQAESPAAPSPLPLSITVERRVVCGVDRIYPVCERARVFARLTKKRTLFIDDLRLIESLGFTVIYEGEA